MDDFQSTVEYRDVPGFPGYRVGNDGSVWSRWVRRGRTGVGGGRRGTEMVLGDTWWHMKASPTRGYYYVDLYVEGRRKRIGVHTLVLLVFVGPCPPDMECCHADDDPTNNNLHNLRWDTPLANKADAVRNGKARSNRGRRWVQLTATQVEEILVAGVAGNGSVVLSRRFGVSAGTISNILRGRTWTDIRPDIVRPVGGDVRLPLRRNRNLKSKIAESDVRAIRCRVAAGELRVVVARDYGLAPSTITQIVNGERWKHVV